LGGPTDSRSSKPGVLDQQLESSAQKVLHHQQADGAAPVIGPGAHSVLGGIARPPSHHSPAARTSATSASAAGAPPNPPETPRPIVPQPTTTTTNEEEGLAVTNPVAHKEPPAHLDLPRADECHGSDGDGGGGDGDNHHKEKKQQQWNPSFVVGLCVGTVANRRVLVERRRA